MYFSVFLFEYTVVVIINIVLKIWLLLEIYLNCLLLKI